MIFIGAETITVEICEKNDFSQSTEIPIEKQIAIIFNHIQSLSLKL